MTFPGGTHDLWLRYWLAAGGIDPDKDVSTIVVPPPQMVANMKVGNMDVFCVGEPWNEQLVNQDIGYTATTTGEIWSDHPEKVLGVRADWVDKNPAAARALVMAVQEAQQWCEKLENKDEMAQIVGQRQWFNVPVADIIGRIKGDMNYGLGRKASNKALAMKFWGNGAAAIPTRATTCGSSPRTSVGASSIPRPTSRRSSTRSTARTSGAKQRKLLALRPPTFPQARRAARKPSSTARFSIPQIPQPI